MIVCKLYMNINKKVGWDNTMEGICRLCREKKELAGSHIIPKMFYKHIKERSETGGIRLVSDPNKRLQDGLKLPFLCHDCEQLFSKYEKYFSDNFFQPTKNNSSEIKKYNTKDDNLRYFILSVAWRCLKYIYETDKEMLEQFTTEEKLKLESILEHWRDILYNENLKETRIIQMHLIPTKELSIFKGSAEKVYNNVAMDFKTNDEKNTFKYAYEYIKVPYFILICTVWGGTSNMKQFLVGKNILVKDSRLPQWLNRLIISHLQKFESSKERLSEKSIESILKNVKK